MPTMHTEICLTRAVSPALAIESQLQVSRRQPLQAIARSGEASEVGTAYVDQPRERRSEMPAHLGKIDPFVSRAIFWQECPHPWRVFLVRRHALTNRRPAWEGSFPPTGLLHNVRKESPRVHADMCRWYRVPMLPPVLRFAHEKDRAESIPGFA